jgi:hypothetical protein
MVGPRTYGDPLFPPFGSVSHYYGDIVRSLFLGAAIMTGLAIPFTPNIQSSVLLGAPAIVALLVLAGLTHPHGKIVLIFDVAAAALGVVATQLLAIGVYQEGWLPLAVFIEVLSIVFMAALYFGIKTLRAMVMGKVGKIDGVGEFDEAGV